ncbi:dephospho-CoA kinase [Propionivibrio dicarboxylicus]|uniref:dephospho-CoA kinase n=1 Tax=Propionivibrio dicarboxylicus TaxID=83767 RepID=UPI000A9A037C
MSVWVVGLTGGIGSGKSTVADLFAARGIAVVDTDVIARELTAVGGAAMPDIEAAFGAGVIAPDGSMDRAAMRQRAFADTTVRQRLEAILHPRIRREADRRCGEAVSPYVLLAVPLLAETGSYRDRVARILVVDCPESTQLARVMARNGLSVDSVRAIMATQVSRADRLALADDVVTNDGARESLVPQVETLHRRYLQLAGSENRRNG